MLLSLFSLILHSQSQVRKLSLALGGEGWIVIFLDLWILCVSTRNYYLKYIYLEEAHCC